MRTRWMPDGGKQPKRWNTQWSGLMQVITTSKELTNSPGRTWCVSDSTGTVKSTGKHAWFLRARKLERGIDYQTQEQLYYPSRIPLWAKPTGLGAGKRFTQTVIVHIWSTGEKSSSQPWIQLVLSWYGTIREKWGDIIMPTVTKKGKKEEEKGRGVGIKLKNYCNIVFLKECY